MAIDLTREAFTPTDTLFLTVSHNLPGVSEGAEILYYTPGARDRLRHDLISDSNHYFALFSSSYDYSDYFACAEYGTPEDWLADFELDTFRGALDSNERDCLPSDLHPSALLKAYFAVVDRRIRSNDLAICQEGIALFNFVMECALPTNDNRNPRCYIKLQTAKEFAPGFIDKLLEAARAQALAGEHRQILLDSSLQNYLSEALQPLQPLLDMLAKIVNYHAWPQNDFALGKFLLLVDYYRALMREWCGEG